MRLYKYCPWNSNKHILNDLNNSILYFQKPELLNDPFDVFPSASKNLSATFIQGFRNNIGICCFATDPKNLVMWAHYSDKHSGICLCFDFPDDKSIIIPPPHWNEKQRQVNSKVFPQRVTYVTSRPKINYMSANNLTSFFLTKYEAWHYEKEYRAFTMEDYGAFNYRPECLTGIIAGCKMSDKDLAKLSDILKTLPVPVTLYQTVPEHAAFRLDITKV